MDSNSGALPGRAVLDTLRSDLPVVLPSMLMCDFGNLADEVRRLESGGARGLHLDVMDGHFVPNMTYGLSLVAAFDRLTELPLDVHLMISQPERYVRSFVEAGADIVTIHIEATESPRSVLEEIRGLGKAAGLAINPPTPLAAIEPMLDVCDLVLVMSVMPGFGGQEFDQRALDKLSRLRAEEPRLCLEVDGGVNDATARSCAEAGAELLVAGSAIFSHDDYAARIRSLRESAVGSAA